MMRATMSVWTMYTRTGEPIWLRMDRVHVKFTKFGDEAQTRDYDKCANNALIRQRVLVITVSQYVRLPGYTGGICSNGRPSTTEYTSQMRANMDGFTRKTHQHVNSHTQNTIIQRPIEHGVNNANHAMHWFEPMHCVGLTQCIGLNQCIALNQRNALV